MCQLGSEPQIPSLSSQGVTLDDFQGTFWIRCSVSMNQLPKLVSSVWVTETVATELSPLTLAFLDGLASCCMAPGPPLGLGSQKKPQKGGSIAVNTNWDPLLPNLE